MSFITHLIPSLARSYESSEQTSTTETPVVLPAYTVNEIPEAWSISVHLPGVTKSGVSVTDEEGVLVIRGERVWKKPTAWVSVHRESSDRVFELSLQHENAIDADKIVAELADGVLRLSLPKAQSPKPRQIAVG